MHEFLPSRSEFWHNKLSVRQLVSPKGIGFVIRLIDTDVEPPRFLVAARQPGHETVSVISQTAVHVHHAQSTVEHRYYPEGNPVPETPEVVIAQLDQHVDTHPHAKIALALMGIIK